jgi:hypothetical protein
MQIAARLVRLLDAADGQLLACDSDLQLIQRKACYGKHDPNAFVFSFYRLNAFDVVRGITIAGVFRDPIEHPLDILEAQEQRIVSYSRHSKAPALRPSA